MQSGESPEGSFQVIKLLSRRPSQWEQCVAIGRLKFEKYFKRKVMQITVWTVAAASKCSDFILLMFWSCFFIQALQLLHSFPLDTRLKDGSKDFWKTFICTQWHVTWRLIEDKEVTIFFSLFSFILAVPQKTSSTIWVWLERPFVSDVSGHSWVLSLAWNISFLILLKLPVFPSGTSPSSPARLGSLQRFTTSLTQKM